MSWLDSKNKFIKDPEQVQDALNNINELLDGDLAEYHMAGDFLRSVRDFINKTDGLTQKQYDAIGSIWDNAVNRIDEAFEKVTRDLVREERREMNSWRDW